LEKSLLTRRLGELTRAEAAFSDFAETGYEEKPGKWKGRSVSELIKRPKPANRFENLFFTPHLIISGRFSEHSRSHSGVLAGKKTTRLVLKSDKSFRS
jgi:hypothetical protein